MVRISQLVESFRGFVSLALKRDERLVGVAQRCIFKPPPVSGGPVKLDLSKRAVMPRTWGKGVIPSGWKWGKDFWEKKN